MALEPITRTEHIMSGESLTPITREEMFLAKAAGQDVETPTPITRREMFLSQISGGSGGGSSGGDEWLNDGNTHVWISLPEGRTSPMLGVCPNGTITVDWGDGTEPDTLIGTSTNTVKWTPSHEYAKHGDYIITLTCDGTMNLYGQYSGVGSGILRSSELNDKRNAVYQAAVKKIEVGSNVTVGAHAFCDCCAVKSINIHSGATGIGQEAFKNCFALESVVIPDGATSFGYSAFWQCYSLKNIVIPDSVTSFGNETFRHCYSLKSITLPKGMVNFGENVFRECYGLENIIIPHGMTKIAYSTFNGCRCLESVVIPDSVTSIEEYAFHRNSNLRELVIPDSVTSIGNSAFFECAALSSVVISKNVNTLTSSVFYGCVGVRFYDFSRHTAVPTMENTSALQNIPYDCEIRVPAALYDEWIAATNWSTYASRIVAV